MSEKKKILAVDDESDVLLILKTALLSEGYDVVTATNGADAIVLVNEEKPDLIVLDMMMPEMNGFDTLRKIRETPRQPAIPVIMLTGLSDKEMIREALDLGIDYYIVKPFEFHDLISKVKIAIADSSRPSGEVQVKRIIFPLGNAKPQPKLCEQGVAVAKLLQMGQ